MIFTYVTSPKIQLKGQQNENAQKFIMSTVQGLLQGKVLTRKIFKLDSWSPGADFFPIGTIN